jgi:hypothetical protein
MNKRQRKKRTRRCGFFHYDKELCKKLKKGYLFPWVSEQGFCSIPLCKPGDCLICRFCSDVFLDWYGPYGVVCRFGRRMRNCNSFMLDKDQPLFHPEDRTNIDEYITHIRSHNDSDKDTQGFIRHQDLFNDEEIIEYINKSCEEREKNLRAIYDEYIDFINYFISVDEKSLNQHKDFSDEEITTIASIGKKLRDPSFYLYDLSESENSTFNKLTKRMYEEKDRFKNEFIREYLDNKYGNDKDNEQDPYGNEADIIDIDELSTEEDK